MGVDYSKLPRTGNGFDVHRLVEGRRCIICGVDILHPQNIW